jgi:probable metal-binding protein
MSSEIHGHEVIAMMRETGKLYTRESLVGAINERFGAETRFHTCSANGMTALQLVEFLARNGKFARYAGGFTIDMERVCQH